MARSRGRWDLPHCLDIHSSYIGWLIEKLVHVTLVRWQLPAWECFPCCDYEDVFTTSEVMPAPRLTETSPIDSRLTTRRLTSDLRLSTGNSIGRRSGPQGR